MRRLLLFHSYLTPCSLESYSTPIFHYSLGFRGSLLLVFRLFSAQVALYVVVVLMCLLGEVSSVSFYPNIYPKISPPFLD